MHPSSLYKLNDGNMFPMVGFGTFRIQGQSKIRSVVKEALKAGYRSFDTAAVYSNEVAIGLALKELLPKFQLSRKDVFITSKLSPDNQGGGTRTEEGVRMSIENLQCEYLDLYLIHWPGTSRLDTSHPDNAKNRRESWATLVKLKKAGDLRSIGVSNYTVRHVRELMEECEGIPPAVNQIEWHPHYHQEDLFEECKKLGILVQAYSSLGGTGNNSLLNDQTVSGISQQLGRTPAQVLLRWALQRGVAIIPKATAPERIQENLQLDFEIPEDAMHQLDGGKAVRKYAWNPDKVA